MGTVINEVGSTAGGIAKVEYKDQSGNVLWYYDDAGNFVRNGNAKITGLAGTGTRMVVADATGNLSASGIILKGFIGIESGDTPTVTLPQPLPNSSYSVYLTIHRPDYNGVLTCTARDRAANGFKIHYYAGDGAAAVVHWLLVY